MIPAEFRLISGIPAEIPGKNGAYTSTVPMNQLSKRRSKLNVENDTTMRSQKIGPKFQYFYRYFSTKLSADKYISDIYGSLIIV
jgi:hypothetical protein